MKLPSVKLPILLYVGGAAAMTTFGKNKDALSGMLSTPPTIRPSDVIRKEVHRVLLRVGMADGRVFGALSVGPNNPAPKVPANNATIVPAIKPSPPTMRPPAKAAARHRKSTSKS